MFEVFITAISYLLLPTVIIIIFRKSLSKKARNIICIINCIIVCLLWQISGYYLIEGYKINFTTGLFYYFILSYIVNAMPEINNKNNILKDIKKKDSTVVKSTNKIKLKHKKPYIFLTTASLILNILLIIGVVILFSSNNNIIKQKNNISKDVDYCKSLLKEINFYSSPNWEQVWDPSLARYVNTYEIDYFIDQDDFENIEKCYEKLNIKINK